MQKPVVLVFSGFDPTGGAGTLADVQTLSAVGCYPVSIVTALTVQDTHTVYKVVPVRTSLLFEQAQVLFQDFSIVAIKIGLIGSVKNALTLARILQSHPRLPVILDPVLYSGGGVSLADKNLQKAILTHLMPLVTIATPNIIEANALAKHYQPQINLRSIRNWMPDFAGMTTLSIANVLLKTGCHAVWVTGTESGTSPIQHPLFISGVPSPIVFSCERLPYVYHGSGCTLAASLAGFIAKGASIPDACQQALDYTLQTLKEAYTFGKGQKIPNRFFSYSKV